MTFNATANKGPITNAAGLCLDGECSDMQSGCAQMMFATCSGSASQQWTHTSGGEFINCELPEVAWWKARYLRRRAVEVPECRGRRAHCRLIALPC